MYIERHILIERFRDPLFLFSFFSKALQCLHIYILCMLSNSFATIGCIFHCLVIIGVPQFIAFKEINTLDQVHLLV